MLKNFLPFLTGDLVRTGAHLLQSALLAEAERRDKEGPPAPEHVGLRVKVTAEELRELFELEACRLEKSDCTDLDPTELAARARFCAKHLEPGSYYVKPTELP